MNRQVIGIIDSGIGGLSIWQAIGEILPNESTIVFSDHAYAPYGEKTPEEVRERVISIIQHLIDYHVKLIIIACNTATVAGIDVYRTTFQQIPIIGVVPVIKTAAEQSKKHSFAVLSTDATTKSAYQRYLIETFAPHCTVYSISASPLVTLIEQNVSQKEIQAYITTILPKSLTDRIDTIVLGCTHFPFIKKYIEDHVGSNIQILDSSQAVGRQVERILTHNHQLSHVQHVTHRFITTGNMQKVRILASHLCAKDIPYTHEEV
jgi:glutamate racemase